MDTWYFKDAVSTSPCNVLNWFDAIDGTGNNPAAAPWSASATKDDDLLLSSAATAPPVIDGAFGTVAEITGTCTIVGMSVGATGSISGGNYSQNLANGGAIYGGVFLLGSGVVNSGAIYDAVVQEVSAGSGTVYGGAFLLNYYNSMGTINGGFFRSTQFMMGTVNGGVFCHEFYAGFWLTTINSGLWINSGTLRSHGYNFTGTGTTEALHGTDIYGNNQDYDPATGKGLHIIDIPGQDVLGCGLL